MKTNLELLKSLAARQVCKYPQYQGYFDTFVMVRIKRDVKTKMGKAFYAGEWTIASPLPRTSTSMTGKTNTFMSVWSFSNEIETSVKASDVEIL